jgi:D-xylose transport system substrate-binding protein
MRKNILLLALIISASGCNTGKNKIGFILPNLNNKRYLIERDYVKKLCDEKNIELLFAASDNDERKQMDQFDSILQEGAKVIILDPVNRFTAAEMIRKAHNNHIPVISYDRLIEGCKPDAYISFNAHLIGEQIAQYALSRKPKGRYVILSGDKSDINAIWINEGIIKILEPAIQNNSITIDYKCFVENWDENETEFILNKYLDLSMDTPDVILSSSDLMSRGCLKVLKEKKFKLKNIIITGQNAESYACKEIIAGNQKMTVYKPVKKLAEMAVNLSLEFLNNKNTADILNLKINNNYAEIPSALLNPIVIDSSSINILLNDGYINENELK